MLPEFVLTSLADVTRDPPFLAPQVALFRQNFAIEAISRGWISATYCNLR